MNFNHFDKRGQAIMVDVSAKYKTQRSATAAACVRLSPAIVRAIVEGQTTKGDVLVIARIAGINASKKTPELIPLAHPLAIHHAAVEFNCDCEAGIIEICATVRAYERTGVEMEAMVSASMAALTIYDMCKGLDKSIHIEQVRLLHKEGGKSGTYRVEESL